MIIFFGFGLWFWGLIALELILLLWFVEQEWALASIISVAVFAGLLWWLADIPIWKWIHDNPGTFIKYCMYYILIGLCWSVIKYYFILKKIQKFVKEARNHWEKKIDVLSTEYKTFRDYLNSKASSYDDTKNHSFKSSTKKLVFWAMFWIPSMIWTVIDDPIRKLFRWLIFDIFIGIYRSMYNQMIGKVIDMTIEPNVNQSKK